MEIKRYSKNLFKIFEDYVEIYIHNYKTKELLGIITIDLIDWNLAKNYKWCLNQNGYARNGKLGLMHRFILNPDNNQFLDHIDENPLNNRRNNLRIANKSLNGYNNSKARKDSKTGIRGVTFQRGKYRATIRIDGKQKFLGRYDSIEEAQKIYESYRKEMI